MQAWHVPSISTLIDSMRGAPLEQRSGSMAWDKLNSDTEPHDRHLKNPGSKS